MPEIENRNREVVQIVTDFIVGCFLQFIIASVLDLPMDFKQEISSIKCDNSGVAEGNKRPFIDCNKINKMVSVFTSLDADFAQSVA